MKWNIDWNPSPAPWEAEGISRRGSIARYLGCLAISLTVWFTTAPLRPDTAHWVLVLDVVLGVCSFVVLHLRRRYGVTIALLTAIASIFSTASTGPATLAAVSVATRRKVPQVVLIGLANVAAAVLLNAYVGIKSETPLIDLSVNFAFAAAMMAWGMYIGSRRELLYNLRDRAQRAEAEQALRSEKARGDERSRIAREMHDVLAHRISQVSMQAGALTFREDLSTEQLRAGVGVIHEQANLALEDLRSVLGVLRDPDTGQLLDRPQPTWRDIEALVQDAREAGQTIEFTDTVCDAETLAPAIGRTAYRMVQEGLTNARKHAPGATITLQVSGDAETGLAITISNPLGFAPSPVPTSGLGLVGLNERAELAGGTLEHRRDGHAFVLRCWLPWSP
ncbi:sensor histidine kinase [Nocardioides sp. Bht2]|uniref:sensor histidine kinase n=1 Tax=Nocardioides sp. Bht2 TaxID=3392297 RepID=UPI0039B665A5